MNITHTLYYYADEFSTELKKIAKIVHTSKFGSLYIRHLLRIGNDSKDLRRQ